MPGPFVKPIPHQADMPEAVDVVVIGGGVIGCMTALELAERGTRVALCEKGGIGREQSSRNWGWVRITMRDPREVPLMAEAQRLWLGMAERVGQDVGYRRAGIGFNCETDADLANHTRWMRHVEGLETGTRMLSEAEARATYPGGDFRTKGVLWTDADGRAEPQLAAPAMALAARRAGAHVLTECAVRALDISAGKVSGVITEHGRIRAEQVVLAGGAWSTVFADNHDLVFPQLNVLNSVLRTAPVIGAPEAALHHDTYAFRKRLDGGYTVASSDENIYEIVPRSFRYARAFWPVLRQEWRSLRLRFGWRFLDELRIPRHWQADEPSPFEYARVLDPRPNRRLIDGVYTALQAAFPVFRGVAAAQYWGGYIDTTPDVIPVISAVDAIPGFYLASGFSGHGFGISPAAGRMMADLVSGQTPSSDPTPFRFSRFTDGSALVIDKGY